MMDELQRIRAFSDSPLYNIKAVVQKTAIQTSTLRAWERRYGIPNPGRSAHGHRLYSPRDLAIINWLRQRVEEGMSIGHAVSLLHQTSSDDAPTIEQPSVNVDLEAPIDLHRLQQHLLHSLLQFDLRHAHMVVNNACAIAPVEQVVIGLFQPTVAEIDQRWGEGVGTVAEEHFASNFIRQRLLGMFQIYAPLTLGPRVVCACPSEEHHELGLLMFALLLQQRGWEIIYLGQSTPLDGLLDCLKRTRCDVLCMSASSARAVEPIAEIGRLIECSNLTPRPLFVYSGRAFALPEVDIDALPGTRLIPDLFKATDQLSRIVEQPQRLFRRERTAA
ncbi:MAG: MerR family transcriptional regulator [Chloroflexales bacterium]|nr:MerR family transcriptional regulator [Chloroflexales bacterium]